jgi:hypothetical protein
MNKLHGLIWLGRSEDGGVEFTTRKKAIQYPSELPDYRIGLMMFPTKEQALGYADGILDSGSNVRLTTPPGGPDNTCLLVTYLDQAKNQGDTLEDIVPLRLKNMDSIPQKIRDTVQKAEESERRERLVNTFLEPWFPITEKIKTIQSDDGKIIWHSKLLFADHKPTPFLELQRFQDYKITNVILEKESDNYLLKIKIADNFVQSGGFSRPMSNLAKEQILEEVDNLNHDIGQWSYDENTLEIQWRGEKEDLADPLQDIGELSTRMTEICTSAQKAHNIASLATNDDYLKRLELIAESGNIIQGSQTAGPYWIYQKGVKTPFQLMSIGLDNLITNGLIEAGADNDKGKTYRITPRGLQAVFEGYHALAKSLVEEFRFIPEEVLATHKM